MVEISFLQIALEYAARFGWYLHPCVPQDKKPLLKDWEGRAAKDEATIRERWTKWPEANIGIACGPSGLVVVDIDHGLSSEADLLMWMERNSIPTTYTVRTGRRPEFGAQLYYSGAMRGFDFMLDGCTGQIRGQGQYVMAAGCIHPDSKQRYEVLFNLPIAPLPDAVQNIQPFRLPVTGGPMEKIPEGAGRHAALTSIAGTFRYKGFDQDAILAQLIPANESMCEVPVSTEELEHIAHSVCRYEVGQPGGTVTIGGAKTVTDWREHYHSLEQMQNAPPAAFLIEGFLQQDAITALAAPVGQRKSLVALNVAHALCTGEPLFDYFKVTKQPTRVLYLCPEMGIRSFTDRLRKIGLMPFVGKTLFCRTMSAEGTLALSELTPEELGGAAVIIDTAVRYLKGDENSSEHMRAFAEDVFRLMREGAMSVLLLHHSAKGTKETAELTLENAMRGSGELGAFVSSCWATRLQDPSEPYQSPSYLSNVKQRDYESKPFEVTSGPDCRLHIVKEPGDDVVLSGKKLSDRDGREAEAVQIILDNPTLSLSKLVRKMAECGIERSKSWVGNKRSELLHTGVTTGS